MSITPRARIGDSVNHRSPNWGPLEEFLPLDLCSDFMWMHEIELRDRTRIHAYKHHATRNYLFLDLDGGTWEYTETGKYRELPPYWAMLQAFTWWLHPDEAHANAAEKPDWKQRAALKATIAHIFGEDEPTEPDIDEWDDEDRWTVNDEFAMTDDDLPTNLGPDI